MSTRKYYFVCEKRKKKELKLIQSKKDTLNKFFTTIKKQEQEELNETINNENENCEEILKNNNLNSPKDSEEHENSFSLVKELDKSNEDFNSKNEINIKNIYDPTNWSTIDSKLIDLLIDKGPIRLELDFSKNNNSIYFSIIHYTRKLPNGENYDRKWLVYSKELDKVFYFCCKLFSLKIKYNSINFFN